MFACFVMKILIIFRIGTGKTATLVAIIRNLYLQNICTHITAPTNKAIRVIIERYVELYHSDRRSSLAGLVLMGRKKRLEIESEHPLSNCSFHFRIERLMKFRDLLFQAIGELRGCITDFGLVRDYEMRSKAGRDLPSFPIFFRKTVLGLLVEISNQLNLLFSQHPFLIRSDMRNALEEVADWVENWTNNFDDYFGAQLLMAWQRDMESEDPQSSYADRELFASVRTQLSNCSKLVQKLHLPPKDYDMGNIILNTATLVFSTVSSGAGQTLSDKRADFEVCIVDEATQLVEALTAQVFSPNLQCLVLAGDHCQLPATVISQIAKRRGYDRSLFDRLISNGYPNVLLDTQYRMHPEICAWPNKMFYGGKIQNGENVYSESHAREWNENYPPVLVLDAAYGVERESSNTSMGTKSNELEEKMVRALVNDFRKMAKAPTTLGIISPYAGQVSNLKDLTSLSTETFAINVSTVDGCQGQEYDLVIFSAVRANERRSVGFLSDVRRLNVAITRPKFSLVVVCNVETVSADRTWRSFINHAQSSGHIARESPIIQKVSQRYVAQMRNMDELLSPSGYLFEKCSWRISFTGEFKESLGKSSKRPNVLLVLQTLGCGKWTDEENLISMSGKVRSIIHVSRVDSALRLIWSVDVQRSVDSCKQCIKVWDLVTVADHSMDKKIGKVERGYSIYSEQYLERCMERQTNITFGRIVMVPKVWEKDKHFVWTKTIISETASSSELEGVQTCNAADDSIAFMKFYELSSKVARILIKSADSNLDLPFVMSEEEEEVVKFPGSVFILGRSGTGKTTVMLHRMLMEQHFISEAKSEVPARQIFVTASPVLCEAIKRSHESMRNTMLQQEGQAPVPAAQIGYVQAEEEIPLESMAFEDIEDSKFPLIITYNTFMEIMYNTLLFRFPSCTMSVRRDRGEGVSNEVHFDTFRFLYYPHFSKELTSKVDVKTVYTEIRSVLKGSLEALASPTGRLSETQYLALSQLRNSELSETIRKLIYAGFEKYEQMKGVREEYDMEDFVFHLHSCMSLHGFLSKPCTSVFVDEVQDLSAAQISLFKFCCPNLTGFVMAGDTAQTISEGVGFRFEALKDVFFHQYLKGLTECEAKNLTPKVWELTQNFRTHNGVLFLARIIIDLIIHFFPNSIDRMKPESSLVFGPKPIFLESQSGGENLVAQLFHSEGGAANMVNFGAEQVILVRDEESKRMIVERSGQNALVITALESKGMEFDDVMIVNFFSSSPFKNEWRVVENFSISEESKETTSRRRFDPMKHSILNTELKMLYVLVTRAKKRLIITDDDFIARKPMLDLLLSRELIEMKVLDDDIRSLFSGQSSSEEWVLKGDAFMMKRQYSNAKFCYAKGGDTLKEQHANAAQFEQDGDRVSSTDEKLSHERYSQAAALYQGLNKLSDTVRCLEKGKEFDKAAVIYEALGRWNDAGSCYEKILNFESAAVVYWKSFNIPSALRCSYACHLYQPALEQLQKVPANLQPKDYNGLLIECARKGALYFHKKKRVEEMMKFVMSFPTTNSKREFLRQ